MEYTINQIIDYFAKTSIEFVNIITNQLQPYQTDGNRETAKGVSGIVIPLSGCGNFSFNDTTYKMCEGTIVHAGPQMSLKIETVGGLPWEYAVIHYRNLKSASPDLTNNDFLMQVKQTGKIKEFVYQLIKCSSEPGSYPTFRAKVIFLRLIEEMLDQAKKHEDGKNSSIIPKAIDFIQENYADNFSVAELAEMFHMERRRFSELFEQYIGLTPIRYLTEYRIRAAQELLRIGQHSVAEIAEMTGYQDHFYFSRVFKKHVGMSPSHYKKYIKENYIYM